MAVYVAYVLCRLVTLALDLSRSNENRIFGCDPRGALTVFDTPR
jgi:hypothetical protein